MINRATKVRRGLGAAGTALAGAALGAPGLVAPAAAAPVTVSAPSTPSTHVPAQCRDSHLSGVTASGIYSSPSFAKRGCYNDVNVIHAYYTNSYRGQYRSGGTWVTGTAGWININSGNYHDSSTWKVLISNLSTGTSTRWQSPSRPAGVEIAS